MNRVLKLEDLCSRIGIFRRGGDRIEWGPYGYLLLNQIKSMWLERILNNYPNMFLADSDPKRLDYFKSSVLRGGLWLDNNNGDSAHQQIKQQFGLASVTPDRAADKPGRKSPHVLFAGIQSVTELCAKRIDLTSSTKISTDLSTTIDAGTYWQNERVNWWSKFLNSPQNMSAEKFDSDDPLEPNTLHSNIVYKVDDELSLVCETITLAKNGLNKTVIN